MNVLILHTAPPESVEAGRHVWEFDLEPAAKGIAEVLPDATVAQIRGEPREILAQLERHAPDVVFNLCEAPLGRPELEPHVAALLEWAGVRFTGSGSETLALCRRKDRVGLVLTAAGVAVPRRGGFPCIVKPADQDGSAGIDHDCICEDDAAVARACARVSGPVVIEEFLPGREFVVSLWGPCEPEHVSIGETRFQRGLRLNTYAAKWEINSADYTNSPLTYDVDLDRPLHAAIVAAAQGAWRAVGARGYARIDVRLDADGQPRVLDVNPNPEIGPEVGIHRAVLEAGWTWPRFVNAQLGVGVKIRELQPGDRSAVREALVACGAFTDEEVRVALEVLDAGLTGGLDGDYPMFAAEVDGRVAGYVCVGQTPLTHSTWHLYWICVHPEAQGRGIGRALQAHAEAFVQSRSGERIVLETSATASYARARAFYTEAGYAMVGRIPDFYRPGDDCLIYCRAFAPGM